MTEVVYACDGGYEDFVYGSSFDKKQTKICTPQYRTEQQTYGFIKSYPSSRQRYTDNDLRAFVYLVESSYDKHPHDIYFGSFGEWNNQGHVSRNILLVTRLTDITGPVATLTKTQFTRKPTPNTFDLNIQYQFHGCLVFDMLDLYLLIDGSAAPTKQDLSKYPGLKLYETTETYTLDFEAKDLKVAKSA